MVELDCKRVLVRLFMEAVPDAVDDFKAAGNNGKNLIL
jgi:hypothetical protein